MAPFQGVSSAFLLSLGLFANLRAQNLGYDTSYYYDLYGSQVAEKTPSFLHFAVSWRDHAGSPRIRGPYKSKTYKKGKLTTVVYYILPELKAIAVEYQLPHAWTEKQITAALKPYGKEWKSTTDVKEPIFSRMFIKNEILMSESGVLAHYSHFTKRLTILSPHVLAEFDKVLAVEKAKKEKVPEF